MKRFTLLALLVLVGCGKDRSSFDDSQPSTDVGQNSPVNGAKDGGGGPAKSDAGVGYGDDIPLPPCGPHNCKTGCCSGGKCVEGTAPKACGKGGLDCADCSAVGFGCKDQGCNPATTCPGCDGCCKAGTCNTNGKTQDNACGSGGAVCVDCSTSGQTCDGNGHCR